MKKVCWPYFDPDFDNLPERINGPRQVDSVNEQDLLLEVVQVLTDLNLSIVKGYISSDARWFMDVFHVKDEQGNKLTDQTMVNHIQKSIEVGRVNSNSSARARSNGKKAMFGSAQPIGTEHTAIEMTAADRPGLFSEISATLADLHCNIVEAHAWSHNACLACVAYISDQFSRNPIDDPLRLTSIEDHLTTVLRANPHIVDVHMKRQEVKTVDVHSGECTTITNVERRLHQLMLSVRDFDMPGFEPSTSPRSILKCGVDEEGLKAMVSIESCYQKGYSIVSVECRDRPRVIFDAVCTLIDMHYVISHASISSHDGYAFQEYFIRHRDGKPLSTECEKERVIKCLVAATERRVCEGVKLEMWANNRVGLLSDITRVLRENGLAVVRADVETQGEKAINAFYVRDVSGKNVVDMEFVESMRREMSPIYLHVKNEIRSTTGASSPHYFSLSNMVKSHLERFSQTSMQ
ncbi:hypothetical protein Cgig2_028745 [Carnegiea gigantea]|uniref:ACT domain-containing protein ACR n=1 Tax=Carnegiea gigantea TaxID=171969 RepID=A0A9Q1JN00_9CARY|nr:hypothetical protein Cgig2_028745 [Carnegiea gigantea]